MSEDKIAETLGIEPYETVEGEIIVPSRNKDVYVQNEDSANEELSRDHKYARENFYDVIEKGARALDEMLDVAGQSQHPRAYEVVATLMKTMMDANRDLVALAERKAKPSASSEEQKKSDSKSVNNTLIFNGSTADLQKMLKDMKEQEEQ
jgi:hypothetical protein